MNYYFLTLMFGCCAYAFMAGGRPEKAGAALYTLSCLASLISYETTSVPPTRWASLETGVFVIDILTFGVFVILAVRVDRFWPIWVSALLGLGVLGHLARIADTSMIRWTYAVSISIWSYPILASIAIGTFNYHRRKTQTGRCKSRPISA